MKADQLVLKTVIQLVKKDEDDDSAGPKKLDNGSLYCIVLHCKVSYGIL